MDIFLRNMDEAAIKHIDEIAKRQGRSRQEFLKNYLELLANYPSIIQHEDRLEKIVESQMKAMNMFNEKMNKFTAYLRELGLEDDEE